MRGERESEDSYGEEMKVKCRGGGAVRVLGRTRKKKEVRKGGRLSCARHMTRVNERERRRVGLSRWANLQGKGEGDKKLGHGMDRPTLSEEEGGKRKAESGHAPGTWSLK